MRKCAPVFLPLAYADNVLFALDESVLCNTIDVTPLIFPCSMDEKVFISTFLSMIFQSSTLAIHLPSKNITIYYSTEFTQGPVLWCTSNLKLFVYYHATARCGIRGSSEPDLFFLAKSIRVNCFVVLCLLARSDRSFFHALFPHNAPLQPRRRVSADVGWKRLLCIF